MFVKGQMFTPREVGFLWRALYKWFWFKSKKGT